MTAATESIWQNKILFKVPQGFTELSARKLELDRITDGVPAEMQALYAALAEDFTKTDSPMMAASCTRRADQWRKIGLRGNTHEIQSS